MSVDPPVCFSPGITDDDDVDICDGDDLRLRGCKDSGTREWRTESRTGKAPAEAASRAVPPAAAVPNHPDIQAATDDATQSVM